MVSKVSRLEKEVANFEDEIRAASQFETKDEGKFLYKMLLVLLVLSYYEKNQAQNEYKYLSIKPVLYRLMKKYRKKEYKTDVNPAVPFSHLVTSNFWKIYPDNVEYDKSGKMRSAYLNSGKLYAFLPP